jgi:hypothetical protein
MSPLKALEKEVKSDIVDHEIIGELYCVLIQFDMTLDSLDADRKDKEYGSIARVWMPFGV